MKHASLQCSYDNRRQQLDLQTAELDELRLAFTTQSSQLREAQSEKKRIQAERMDLQAIISGLEADLQRVRWDAENYGNDLRKLRRQKEDAEVKFKNEQEHHARTQKQNKAQIRLLKEQLDTQRKSLESKSSREHIVQVYVPLSSVGPFIVYLRLNVPLSGSDEIETLKTKHSKECKGLFVQIRYLKAKFVREATLRADLTYQKQYLLILLARYERRYVYELAFRCNAIADCGDSEKKIIAAIAQVGFPTKVPSTAVRKKTLRSCAQAVIFLCRSRSVRNIFVNVKR